MTQRPEQSPSTLVSNPGCIRRHRSAGHGGPIRRQQLALSNSYSGFVCLQNWYRFGTHSSQSGKVPTHMHHSDVIYATLGSLTRAEEQPQDWTAG